MLDSESSGSIKFNDCEDIQKVSFQTIDGMPGKNTKWNVNQLNT